MENQIRIQANKDNYRKFTEGLNLTDGTNETQPDKKPNKASSAISESTNNDQLEYFTE